MQNVFSADVLTLPDLRCQVCQKYIFFRFSENFETASVGSFDITAATPTKGPSLDASPTGSVTNDSAKTKAIKTETARNLVEKKVNDYLDDILDLALLGSEAESRSRTESNSDPVEADFDFDYDDLFEESWHMNPELA